jgi:hypothetical protein
MLRQKNGPAAQMLVRSAFLAMRAAGVRPHPFDLPSAEPWMAQIESLLGPAERAYRDRLAGAPVKAETALAWEELTPAERIAAAREQRRVEPAAGRSLIAEHLAAEAALTRVHLVQALAVGLGGDDRELLVSLMADRSQYVKAAAEALLARVPGAEAYAGRLQSAAEACVLKKVGVFGGRRKLELTDAPKTADLVHRVLQTFSGIRLGDLAARLGVKVDDLLGETSDPLAALALVVCGLAEGRTDIMARLATPLADYGAPFLAMRLKELLDDMDPGARAAAFSDYIEAAPPGELYALASWARLLETLDHPLTESASRRLLRSEAAKAAVAAEADDQMARVAVEALTGLAAATPRACAGDLSALLSALGPQGGLARDFAEFLSALPEAPR